LLREKVESLSLSEEVEHPEDQRRKVQLPVPREVVEKGEHAFALFSDGACRGNPGPGAWAALGQNTQGEVLFELSGVEISTTNNKMELEGAIACLKSLQNYLSDNLGLRNARDIHVFLYSDSRYVLNGMDQWMVNWKKNGWKKSDGKTPENLNYWQELDLLMHFFPHLHFVWVKGHSGHPQNEQCDRLANEALDGAGF
jgi:ribonuclease HI